MSSITLGVIGYRNHAAKLISIVEKYNLANVKFIFHPTKKINDKRGTNILSELFQCDAIIIASPNEIHFKYLTKILKNFNGYIFCEKPPVTNKLDLKKLNQLNESQKSRIFFNFMMRFGKINDIIKQKLNSKDIGQTIRIDVLASKGLAFKQDYLDSWRADGEKNLYNILDAKSIHFLDLMNFYLGKIKKISVFPSFISKKGTSYDTMSLIFEYENNIILSIFNSYSTPLLNEISIIGTNGFINFRDKKITIKSPRNVFDKKGFFVSPPTIFKQNFSVEEDYDYSLKKAMEFFINHVKTRKKFKSNLFEKSIETNKIILKIKELMEKEKTT